MYEMHLLIAVSCCANLIEIVFKVYDAISNLHHDNDAVNAVGGADPADEDDDAYVSDENDKEDKKSSREGESGSDAESSGMDPSIECCKCSLEFV